MSNLINKNVTYRLLCRFFYYLFHILFRVKITGQENFNVEGTCLIVANHLSAIDFPLILAFFPRRSWPLATISHRRHPIFGPVFYLADAIFVHNDQADRQALRRAQKILGEGGAIAIHPEGTRSQTGQLQQAKDGVAYLASRSNATIIPVVVVGSETAFKSLRPWHRPVVQVIVGKPFQLPNNKQKVRGAGLTTYTNLIMCHLVALLPKAYHGVYRDCCASQSIDT